MKIDLLGVKIDNLTKSEVLSEIQNKLYPSSSLSADKSIFIVTPYSESIVAAQKDEEFRNALNSADLSLPDGIGVLWSANFLQSGFSPSFQGRGEERGDKFLKIFYNLIKSLLAIIFNPNYLRAPVPEKISGSDFIWDLAELAAKNNYSIFLLGGFGDTAELVAQKLKSKFPDLRIAGTYSNINLSFPHRRESSSISESGMTRKAIDTINSSRADFLFVALGPVAQEKWIYKNLPNLRVKLAVGLGGTFDYIAGKRTPAPQILRQTGLEWLWRLFTQPWRLVRIIRGVLGLIWYSVKYKIIH